MAFRFESLDIWKLAIEYANNVYNVADALPQKELFGLGSQLRRAGVSISNNIAEGSGCVTVNGFKRYLDIAIGSALETVSALYFAEKRNYINIEERKKLYDEAEILIKKIRAFKNTIDK